MLAPLALCLLAQDAQPPALEPTRGVGLADEVVTSSSASYARRHALVVGVDAYEDPAYPDLGYAVADARAVAKMLVDRYGFAQDDVRLILNEDATKDTLERALEDWACDSDRIGAEDLLVVFFAGHGVTRELGSRGSRGYLVPVDGRTDDGERVWSSLLGMADLEDVSEAIPAKHVLFVLDCCFGGLAVSRSAPPVAAGLGNRARQAITAGNAHQTVLDTGGGGHSVFTGALLDGLEGGADLDGDGVVTFGELFNHVGSEVERKTERRQTPLQATLPDHEGGNVALFPPGVKPGSMTAADRLKALERTADEQLAELKRLSDALLILDLQREAEELWPQVPEMVPRYREWLVLAREALERRPQHEASVRQVRQEAYLSQVVAGTLEEGEGTEPVWEEVDRELRWRFDTFQRLVAGLDDLEALARDVERRLEVASTLHAVSIEEHAEAWDEAIASITTISVYDGLELVPQIGLVPLGRDPRSGLWELGHVLTGELPVRDAETGELVIDESTCLVFVLIPGGTFRMGTQSGNPAAPNYDPEARADEGPVHEVTMSPFLVSKYEMTQGQWSRFTGQNPSYYEPGSGFGGKTTTLLHPVENVSWEDCHRILGRLGLDLPSEAQWEYAARGTTSSPWWTGGEKETLHGAANVADAFCEANGGPTNKFYEPWDDGYTVHAPVGSYDANPFGLHDVHGNVGERCLDGYDAGFYGRGAAQDPQAPHAGAAYRVIRGGCFNDPAALARSALREAASPSYAGHDLGVRPAARVITE